MNTSDYLYYQLEAMPDKGKEEVNMEEICKDRCFACKDGEHGSLLVCEFEDCSKAYHPWCVGSLPCKWHSCFICHERSKYQCYCCPKAVCERCILSAEFAKVKGTKGFCTNCIKVLLLAEKQEAAGSKGENVCLKDRNTSDALLYEYWLRIKRNENLGLKHLCFAYDLLKSGEIHTRLSNPSGLDEDGDEREEGNTSISPLQNGKRSNDQRALKKSKAKSLKKEYIGWGSKPLIAFLVSLGKDTSQEVSQLDVATLINKYINENNLFLAQKKKKILCDEKLNDLFGKKTFMRNRIYDLLELHYRENAEFHEQDRQGYTSEDENADDSNLLASKKQKKTDKFKKPEKEVVTEAMKEAPRSCFASVIADNIKLVYLDRSLVIELLEEADSFESMVIGSFVKVKSDPFDYTQKNHNQLVLVTGVKNISPGGKKEDILLQVSNRFDDFPISMLSDGTFTEEECEDLRQKVKSGQLHKLTVVEIEEKAKILHVVKTKHWIVRELEMLQNKADRANEKGWRAEFFQCIERRELLKKEAEQKRLLEEVPKVIAEVLEIDHIASSGNKAGTEDNSLSGNSESSASCGNGMTKGNEATGDIQDSDEEKSDCNNQNGDIQRSEPMQCESQMKSQNDDEEQKMAKIGKASLLGLSREHIPSRSLLESVLRCMPSPDLLMSTNMVTSHPSHAWTKKKAKSDKASLIKLGNEDDNGASSSISLRKKKIEELNLRLWHCLGPNGERVGPFSMWFLRCWSCLSRYALKFEVWKTGESEENRTQLRSAVKEFYRRE